MYSTTLCYLERDGKWLMLHRVTKKNDINEGKYVGVGGKFLEGESPEDCVVREVFEETGYTLTHYRYAGLVTFVSDRFEAEHMHLFTADGFTGAYHDTEEGISAWIPKEEVMQLPLWEGDRIFLPLLQQNIPFFSLKLCYEGDALVAAVLNGKPLSVAPEKRDRSAGDMPVKTVLL